MRSLRVLAEYLSDNVIMVQVGIMAEIRELEEACDTDALQTLQAQWSGTQFFLLQKMRASCLPLKLFIFLCMGRQYDVSIGVLGGVLRSKYYSETTI